MPPDPFLRSVTLLPERVASFDAYPFSIPAVRHLERLDFNPAVTFFAGENGSGKSTLLEALAVVEGLNLEGGSRNFNFTTRAANSELAAALRTVRGGRRRGQSDAFFLRAESFYNVATEAENRGLFPRLASLHEQSHGESFVTLLTERFGANGLYLLDEPEAALSPSRQLMLLRLIRDLTAAGSQFVIATHSPILLGYPGATIYWFSDAALRRIAYEDTEHYKVTKAFLHRREQMLGELFNDDDLS